MDLIQSRNFVSIRLFLIASFLCLLTSCQTIGGFSATSFKQLTSLKAAHVKFIDTNTESIDRSYSAEAQKNSVDEIDLKFQEAIEFSKYLKTNLRTSNYEFLREIFFDDVKNMERKARLLTKIEADTMKNASSFAYDRAIAGECLRPDAKCKSK